MPLAQHHQMMKTSQRTGGYFHEIQQMLYFVQQKWGDNPYLRLNVVKSSTIWAIFPDLEPTAPKLLHKIQHSPFSETKRPENVAFFAGFVASCARCSPGRGSSAGAR